MNNPKLKTIALIGRPNVGKSTLFNRLIGKRLAIETDIPGTTRDRLYGEVFWAGEKFNIMDVAGIEFGTKSEIDQSIQESVELAIESSDLILFIVDWSQKNDEIDRRIAARLRKIDKPVIVVVNKADNLERIQSIDEFKRFGNFDVVPVSAISGKNTGDMLDLVLEKIQNVPTAEPETTREDIINLAIIGRPNMGKSTLINTILGQKRMVVSDVPGTTRDTINEKFEYKGQKINLVDTAGIRRRGKIEKDTIESFSLLRTHKALHDSDIAVLLIDSEEGLVANDVHILGQAKEWGKGLILAVNKIDIWTTDPKEEMAKILGYLTLKLNFTPWLPIVFISAKDNENIKPLLNQVLTVRENRRTIIPQEDLNRILENAKNSNSQLINLKSLIQKRTNPPTFELRFSKKAPHQSQIHYLENKIRDQFPMSGSPIFIDLVSRQKRK